MKLYLDSGDVSEIKEISELGIIDGVTTNPSLIKNNANNLPKLIKEICSIIKASVSVEVLALDYHGMLKEAYVLSEIDKNVTVKLPLTWEGLRVCKELTNKNIKTNLTLCFTPTQAILAAKAGATYVSPFIGRLEDLGQDGIGLVRDIKNIYNNYSNVWNTKILAASIRNVEHVKEMANIGVDVVTLPYKIIKQMIVHSSTTDGLNKFLVDAKLAGYKI